MWKKYTYLYLLFLPYLHCDRRFFRYLKKLYFIAYMDSSNRKTSVKRNIINSNNNDKTLSLSFALNVYKFGAFRFSRSDFLHPLFTVWSLSWSIVMSISYSKKMENCGHVETTEIWMPAPFQIDIYHHMQKMSHMSR